MQLDSVDTSHLVHDDSDWTNTLSLIHGYQDDFSEDIIRQARLYIKKRATPTCGWKTRHQSACSRCSCGTLDLLQRKQELIFWHSM